MWRPRRYRGPSSGERQSPHWNGPSAQQRRGRTDRAGCRNSLDPGRRCRFAVPAARTASARLDYERSARDVHAEVLRRRCRSCPFPARVRRRRTARRFPNRTFAKPAQCRARPRAWMRTRRFAAQCNRIAGSPTMVPARESARRCAPPTPRKHSHPEPTLAPLVRDPAKPAKANRRPTPCKPILARCSAARRLGRDCRASLHRQRGGPSRGRACRSRLMKRRRRTKNSPGQALSFDLKFQISDRTNDGPLAPRRCEHNRRLRSTVRYCRRGHPCLSATNDQPTKITRKNSSRSRCCCRPGCRS